MKQITTFFLFLFFNSLDVIQKCSEVQTMLDPGVSPQSSWARCLYDVTLPPLPPRHIDRILGVLSCAQGRILLAE